MNSVYFELCVLAVLVVVSFVTGAWKGMKKNYADEIETFLVWVHSAVMWAQQIYWSESGEQRKRVVMEMLMDIRNKYKFHINDAQIEVLVEAAVKRMHEVDGVGYVGVDDGDTTTTD